MTMRDSITINTTIKRIGNSYCLPITKAEKNILGIDPDENPDLIVQIEVAQRKRDREQTDE